VNGIEQLIALIFATLCAFFSWVFYVMYVHKDDVKKD
jgi:hypothetical protein